MSTPIINAQMDAINGSMATLKGDLTTLRPLIKTLKENALNAYATESLSNQAVASFTDGAKNIPVKSLSVAITPIQSGTGDPSPDNIRPITGWTGAKVTRTGENLFGGNLMRDGVLASMASATDYPDDRYVSFAANAPVTQRITVASGIEGKFKENTRYTFILTVNKTTGVNANLRINYTDGTYTSIGGAVAGSKTTTLTVSSANKTVASLSKQNSAGTTSLYYDESGIFEGVLTAADFKPYLGNTYPISLGQTVYGGTLNVTTGVLTVTSKILDLGDFDWTVENASTGLFNTRPNNVLSSADAMKFHGNLVCSCFIGRNDRSYSDIANNEICATNGQSLVILRAKSLIYANVSGADFKTAVTGQTLVYELATPTTVQLTPTEVTTLLGVNNIWADTGDITEVTIRCDTALYIAKLVG